MSQASSGFNPASQHTQRNTQAPLGAGYSPTEDERRIFQECNRESFWYRSLPLAALAMTATQVMVTRGVLSASPRFGSLPKLAFAGLCGFFGGKVSYMKICQEKFKSLENSPLGDALRQAHLRRAHPESNQSEFADPNPAVSQQSGFEGAFQPAEDSQPSSYSSYSSDFPSYDRASFSSGQSEPAALQSQDSPLYQEEDIPKKRKVLYEDLRSKNRENYEVALTQRAESLKPHAEVPKKEGKRNKYGDSWEE
ncbi:OCIA domain-containing protein 1 isoform X1 [Astyanax mexicanus]|uniref:OCIA domain-containing protein 1 n=1 Tax=Astyanax mexicanus TaxID=7994 RepID=A0A3B1JRB2_ASTMX|nr:OCIA domain-containing protein 1 isoform X1 [Astyanax mexicanus]